MADDWQVGCKDIKMRMVNLYYSECWHDCKFLVGMAANQTVVTAHKVVLATASPVFSAMFYGKMPETSDQICIQDIDPDTFNEMLRYIYTDNIDISSFADGCALYYAAKKYMLLYLMTECSQYLLSNLTVKTCCYGYEFAKMFDEKKLLNACLKLISEKTSEVLTEGLEDASLDTLRMIYSLESLTISSEMELFEGLQQYIIIHQMQGEVKKEKHILTNLSQNGICQKENGKAESIYEAGKSSYENESGSNPKNNSAEEPTTIDQLLRLIRFLTMTPKEFSKNPGRSPLLSQMEKLNILLNIADPETNLSMPEGFSTNRKKRHVYEDIPDRSRQCYAFNFTVPEWNSFFCEDEIYSPLFYVHDIGWRIICKIYENEIINVYIVKYSGSVPDNGVEATLDLALISKSGKKYSEKFICEIQKEEEDEDDARYFAGHFVAWGDATNEYMDDGCLTFKVQFKIDL